MTPIITRNGFILIGIFAIIVAVFSAISLHGKTFSDWNDGDGKRTGYEYPIPTHWLIFYVSACLLLGVPFYVVIEGEQPLIAIARMLFSIIATMVVYMLVLTIITPYLRKHLSATACILLWTMPSILYYFILFPSIQFYNAPAFVIVTPPVVIYVLTVVWLTGFLVTMIRGFAEHRRFKKMISEDLRDAPRPIRLLYDEVREEMKIKGNKTGWPYFSPPLISSAVQTPLAIGFTKESTRIILPDKEYTDDELRLIFRHELIHIVRRDSWTKLFLLLCRALCWFLPHAGRAAEYAAQDMELSCDEAVLRDQDEGVKQQYGHLILSTASNGAGFTTCLSATAESMKYRLQRILSNEKRRMGIPLITIAFLFLAISFKLVTFAVDYKTMADVLAEENINLDEYAIRSVYNQSGQNVTGEIRKMELTQEILDTHLYRLGGRYTFEEDGDVLRVEFRSEKDTLMFTRTAHSISFHDPGNSRSDQTIYWVK